MTKIKLPDVPAPPASLTKLPFGGELREENQYVFSFVCFDHSHKLFNLGGEDPACGMVSANWFVDFLDCLKTVSGKKIYELKGKGAVHDLHPVDWKNANTSRPIGSDQWEFWQFRINKSKGRVVGIPIDGIFYVVWLDPHHNLSDSDGYRGATYYAPGKSEYDLLVEQLSAKEAELERLRSDLSAAESLIEEYSRK